MVLPSLASCAFFAIVYFFVRVRYCVYELLRELEFVCGLVNGDEAVELRESLLRDVLFSARAHACGAEDFDAFAVCEHCPFEVYQGAIEDVYWLKMPFVGVDEYKRPIEAVEGVADEGACRFRKKGLISHMCHIKDNCGGYIVYYGFVEYVCREFEYSCPERFCPSALDKVEHGFRREPAAQPAFLRLQIPMPVAHVDGALEHFAPLLLFCRIGEWRAQRRPDLVKGDGPSDAPGPIGLAVGTRFSDVRLREEVGHSLDGDMGERLDHVFF